MRPFIYNFLAESLQDDLSSNSQLEFSNELNLTVIKGTDQAAIAYNQLGTQTFTKAGEEPTDSDQDNKVLTNVAGTGTHTRQMIESTDTDHNKASMSMVETKTVTLSHEGVDSDQNNRLNIIIGNSTVK